MTNEWIPSADELRTTCGNAAPGHVWEAIRALIAERHARAAQSAPGAVSRASGLSVEIMAERDRKYGVCCMGAVPSCAAGCAVKEAARRDLLNVPPLASEDETDDFNLSIVGDTAKLLAVRASEDGEVSADEVERVARGIHKAHGSVCSMTCGWDELGPQCRDGYLASASYALSLRSAAEKVPSLGECYGAYTNAWVGVRPQGMSVGPFTDAERAGIAAVRALFVRDESGKESNGTR